MTEENELTRFHNKWSECILVDVYDISEIYTDEENIEKEKWNEKLINSTRK